MRIRASAPGRAGIIGNPTDIYGGSVISCSTKERAYCELEVSDRFLISVDQKEICLRGRADLTLAGDRFDIARAAIAHFGLDPAEEALSIRMWTEVPEQAGLAGSTALLTALFACLAEHTGITLNKYEIAETVRSIEYDRMHIMCGYQDHYMAVFGGLNYMDFRGKEMMLCPDESPYATIEPLTEHVGSIPVVLAHTGVQRSSGTVHKGLRERWLQGETEVVEAYKRIGAIAQEGKRAILRRDWRRLGELMNENHAIQRDLGGSGECNDRLIEVALSHGAYGAKLAGAGRGGTIIALTDDGQRIAEALVLAGAQRILVPEPTQGLLVEREWEVDYDQQGSGADRLCRGLDGR